MVTVREIVSRFGGPTRVREALQAILADKAPSVQTISSWQVVGRIPPWWQARLLEAAKAKAIQLTAEDLVYANANPSEAA